MKKTFFLVAIFMILGFSACAQDYPIPLITKGKPGDATYGISRHLSYEAIFDTSLSKKEVIAKTIEVLKIVGFTDIEKIKLDQISDKQQSFKYPTGFRGGVYAGKGKMGKRLKNPVNLLFDMEFLFSESEKGKQVKIQLTKFSEIAFFKINKDVKFHIEAGFGSMMTPGASVSDERYQEINDIEQKVLKANTAFGKFMTVMEQGGINLKVGVSAKEGFVLKNDPKIVAAFESLKTDTDKEWEVYNKAVKAGIGIWADPSKEGAKFLSMYQEYSPKQKTLIEDTKQRITEDVLLTVDNDRFDNYFEGKFNELFLVCAANAGGSNLKIAKDGEIKYEVNNTGEIKKLNTKK